MNASSEEMEAEVASQVSVDAQPDAQQEQLLAWIASDYGVELRLACVTWARRRRGRAAQ